MRSSNAITSGATLLKTPTHREQMARRRLAVLCAVLGLALASGLVGSLARPAAHVASGPTTGPFSYFPSR